MPVSESSLSPPAGSRIQIIEAGENRQVFFIPEGGKKSKSIGCFALIWNLITGVVSFVFLSAGVDDAPLYFVIPFFGLFWLIGLGFLYWWLKMRFTRTILLLEPMRIVIQRLFLGRKSVTETNLKSDSCASLLVAYEQNNVPVYTIAVEGLERTVKFGTRLSREDKEWFVENINGFLNVTPPGFEAKDLEDTGVPSDRDEIPEKLSTYDLAGDSIITIDESHADRLRFHYPAFPKTTVLRKILGFVTLFSLVWVGFVYFFFASGWKGNDPDGLQIIPMFFSGLMFLFGLFPIFLVFGAIRSRITLELSPERFFARWHFGPLGAKKVLPTAAVTRVILTNRMERNRPRNANVIQVGPKSLHDLKICMVYAGKIFLPLTVFHDIATAREIGGLLIHRFEEMGIALEDE